MNHTLEAKKLCINIYEQLYGYLRDVATSGYSRNNEVADGIANVWLETNDYEEEDVVIEYADGTERSLNDIPLGELVQIVEDIGEYRI